MIVTFVSECHKKSLKETRRILDAYAHRIGQRTWQAIITEEALQAVRTKLSKTARKSTAVSCHRIRGHRRTELLWVVGNRRAFDTNGQVPVNRTKRDVLREGDENDWRYLSILKPIVAVAALFHDFGKAWKPFQELLKSAAKADSRKAKTDPVRHEWISLALFLGFVNQRSDEKWLAELQDLPNASEKQRLKLAKQIIGQALVILQSNKPWPENKPHGLLVNWISWLIVSHHRLPQFYKDDQTSTNFRGDRVHSANLVLSQIKVENGYTKSDIPITPKKDWKFPNGLPLQSPAWAKVAARYAGKLQLQLSLPTWGQLIDLDTCGTRNLLHLSLLSLVIGDHQYSSKNSLTGWEPSESYANTYTKETLDSNGNVIVPKGTLRQFLDEHLVGVCNDSLKIAHLLPSFESLLPAVQHNRPLNKPAKGNFAWQNKAVDSIKGWRLEHPQDKCGFFGLNMASTGQGKTFANAKIMNALNPDSLRYSLALGLRSLTLQTGDEYRKRLQLDDLELAVLIGSTAVQALHQQSRQESQNLDRQDFSHSGGSQSAAVFDAPMEFDADDLIPDEPITTLLKNRKARQFLKSPILVCTIDHLMPASESTRGGGGCLASLRLLSSDLVIDEVDDFDHLDMPAIARLVHLAGMLGRKVLLSSATIPPSIAEGLFRAYQKGWQHFAAVRQRDASVAVFWADEFKSTTNRIDSLEDFSAAHTSFCRNRVQKLANREDIKTRGRISTIATVNENSASRSQLWYQSLTESAIALHRQHSLLDDRSKRHYSLGVIRTANVDPCINLVRHLLHCDLPQDITIRVVCYHARRVLLMRSQLEQHLDQVLCRKANQSPADHPVIQRHLNHSQTQHVLFIVVASPAAEVGRDHDYDWAVIEPSSMRSIIQMAGRVRRHRDGLLPSDPTNIVIPEFNYRAFVKSEKAAFKWPGFEGGNKSRCREIYLNSKSTCDVLDVAQIRQSIDSNPRITSANPLAPDSRLVDLEHAVLESIFNADFPDPAYVAGWTDCGYHLTNLSQTLSPFRESAPTSTYKLHVDQEGQLSFHHPYDRLQQKSPPGTKISNITPCEISQSDRIWLPLDYETAIQQQQERLGLSRSRTCELLGDISVMDADGQSSFQWHPDLGASNSSYS